MKYVRAMIRFLSGPSLLNFTLPILMAYLVAGTVAQKYIGLYEATHQFFSSPVFLLGPVPLPGLPIVIGLIFLNLSCKLIFKSPWRLQNAGILLTHIGVLLLLSGGFLTTILSREGFMDFGVGEAKAFATDYHIRELVLQDSEGRDVYKIHHKDLTTDDHILIPDIPLEISVLETCRNCEIQARELADKTYYGMAQHMKLMPGSLKQNNEENMAGLTFAVKGSEDDGVYVVLEDVLKYPEIRIKDETYRFMLRKQKRELPFQITLLDFKREMHPGTDMARSYESRILIEDNGARWESLIRMNEPLRYKGYTFFQSSFIETPDGDVSVLAVVQNAGRIFPYLSGLVICLGMIVHLLVRKASLPATRKTKQAGVVHAT